MGKKGYTYQKEQNTGMMDQCAIPYEVIPAFSWTPRNKRFDTKEEAQERVDELNVGCDRYWKARMRR